MNWKELYRKKREQHQTYLEAQRAQKQMEIYQKIKDATGTAIELPANDIMNDELFMDELEAAGFNVGELAANTWYINWRKKGE